MLKATAKSAEHLRMTGGDVQGSKAGVRQYNAVINRIGKYVSEVLFEPLDENASFVDLSIACEQLSAYLEGIIEEAIPTRREDTPKINAPYINITGGIPDMGKLGEMIRQAMPSWIREQMEKEEKDEKTNLNDLESRMAELGAQMQVLAEKMHREELSSDEIRKLAEQMRQLGQQQSELAKQHAVVRATEKAG